LRNRLVNMAVPSPGVRFKQSNMPFVQMENISHFLRACKSPPLNLQEHDVFLTVDLYEHKDPAQVLQCLGAFSRAANSVNPSSFPTAIGPRANRGVLSPQSTGPVTPSPTRGRGISNVSNASSAYGAAKLTSSKTGDSATGRWSPTKSPTHNGGGSTSPGISSWSKKEHEGATAPAWNIAQYGYMGGASQGNLGISFGGRRQIIGDAPRLPTLAEKERKRKEEERLQMEAEEEERRRRAEIEAEEERARQEEQQRWEEETRRKREEEKKKADDERRRWEEEERQWKITEENRRREEEEAEARLAAERQRSRSKSDARLRGQFLSQYQAEQEKNEPVGSQSDSNSNRIRELEQELELARQREADYERERQERAARRARRAEAGGQANGDAKSRARSRSRPAARPPSRQDSWSRNEREALQTESDQHQQRHQGGHPVLEPDIPLRTSSRSPTRPLPNPEAASPTPMKVKSHHTGGRAEPLSTPKQVRSHNTGGGARPLPEPGSYSSPRPPPQQQQQQQGSSPMNRTDRYLSSNPAPSQAPPQQTYSRELGATAERDAEDRRRAEGQTRTKAGGWASKSLLEREMEMERQRQREWEEAQRETARAPRPVDGAVDGIGGGIGGRWDVGQWSGYTGGDNQNKGAGGIGAGRRQIVGPRPLPGSR
jgi:transgelin